MTESQGLPVLVENDWGKGKVTYLALDAGRPPLSTWNGLPKFLQSLLTPAAGENLSLRPQWSEAIFSQLLLSPSFVSTYIPTRSLFFAIVGYLAGVVVLSRLWQRRRMTRRTLALSCCGWILCAAAAGYLFFSRGGQVAGWRSAGGDRDGKCRRRLRRSADQPGVVFDAAPRV